MAADISTRRLIADLSDELATSAVDASVDLGQLLDRFRSRAFGVFLLACLLPSFFPIPVGVGAISGPLVCLIGLQLLAQLPHPWLPRRVARWRVTSERLIKFQNSVGRWLMYLEKLIKPRWEIVIDHPLGKVFTGALLLALGVLLGLPIPFTNYLFGLILLLYALALIERDGLLMVIAWLLGLIEIATLAQFSRQVTMWLTSLF